MDKGSEKAFYGFIAALALVGCASDRSNTPNSNAGTVEATSRYSTITCLGHNPSEFQRLANEITSTDGYRSQSLDMSSGGTARITYPKEFQINIDKMDKVYTFINTLWVKPTESETGVYLPTGDTSDPLSPLEEFGRLQLQDFQRPDGRAEIYITKGENTFFYNCIPTDALALTHNPLNPQEGDLSVSEIGVERIQELGGKDYMPLMNMAFITEMCQQEFYARMNVASFEQMCNGIGQASKYLLEQEVNTENIEDVYAQYVEEASKIIVYSQPPGMERTYHPIVILGKNSFQELHSILQGEGIVTLAE